MSDASEYRACLVIARRIARDLDEAADLLHEALVVSVRAGRIGLGDSDRAWLAGVMRNLAAARAREAVRRRRRETDWSAMSEGTAPAQLPELPPASRNAILDRLSEGTRRVAVLALHGMDANEIQFVLRLKPAAFRQRLSALRRALGRLPEPLRSEALAMAYAWPHRAGSAKLDFGLIRRALMHHVRASGMLASHDPDGHLVGIKTR